VRVLLANLWLMSRDVTMRTKCSARCLTTRELFRRHVLDGVCTSRIALALVDRREKKVMNTRFVTQLRFAVVTLALAAAGESGSHGGNTPPDVEQASAELSAFSKSGLFVYVGSSDSGDPGTATGSIAVLSLNPWTGALNARSVIERNEDNRIDHPTFLAFDTKHDRVFSVSENYFNPTPFQSSVASYRATRWTSQGG
jgi:hypothetical protein